jgi:phosphoglycolate phosphatase-like HAD superfamily hydrolase
MTLDISRIKAVCFDIDGTLSETDDLFVKKVVKILSPANFLFENRDVFPLARKLVAY